ncbi:oxidoreductase [Methylacidiphilum kamchatkense Kam1]|uniref:Formate hydrogenlyase subunit 3/multisubunit Na+/H+ antiporter MnhD subunit n=1 Tax=Methylacidiphilum kamchatkense Kam1 TaxID=1202785 RepID=A0A0C1RL15_9BACT|nr:hydrogenase 4 subunit B [Methylacidiphilum kamchatkense]KIE58727.1 oxidoreductase [Methylacidiphilum kamchatkense Kam1]QDQ41878.1 formate hydrogenlyase subunit 3/multisubunit Na+/H+ antiporter MnhD subunit [Methylacidiphilum kamchatkense Kam1]
MNEYLLKGLLFIFIFYIPFIVLAKNNYRFIYLLSACYSGLGLLCSLSFLLSGQSSQSISFPLGLPTSGAHFKIDALSSFFLLIVNLGSFISSLYGIGYGSHASEQSRVLPFYIIFLGSMNMVLLAADAFSFLFFWELMSLSSWALVMSSHRNKETAEAGFIYILMASLGTFALLFALSLIAAPSKSYCFDQMGKVSMDGKLASLIFLLALLGAGSKAGLVPLHVWLPKAHPAAPSHVSALMSGVMTKVAVYGFIRIVFDLLPFQVKWWSILILIIAGISTVVGVLYALMQHDIKRLLAYHTIENIGIVFIGIGLSMAFKTYGMTAASALALTGALFHALNHSIFKNLLFLGSGAIQTATDQRDMEKLGGLILNMPHTALTFLIGSVAISALPPLNGFVSEWLLMQSILQSPQLPSWGMKFLVPSVGAFLTLSAALAASCFVKVYGITFLGRPRSMQSRAACETDRWSVLAMYSLAFLCIIFGIFPRIVIHLLGPVITAIAGTHYFPFSAKSFFMPLSLAVDQNAYNGFVLVLLLGIFFFFIMTSLKWLASNQFRRTSIWDCGYPEKSPDCQYTATSFAQPIRKVFGPFLFATKEKVICSEPWYPKAAKMIVKLRDQIWEYFYKPVAMAIDSISEKINFLQFLTVRRYLVLVFLTLVSLLGCLAFLL